MELKPCPFCGSPAEIVNTSHIRCINSYNCDCETRLGSVAWNRRADSTLRGRVLEGYVMVPKEPSEEMRLAGSLAIQEHYRRDGGWCGLAAAQEQMMLTYKAMLDAANQPTQP